MYKQQILLQCETDVQRRNFSSTFISQFIFTNKYRSKTTPNSKYGIFLKPRRAAKVLRQSATDRQKINKSINRSLSGKLAQFSMIFFKHRFMFNPSPSKVHTLLPFARRVQVSFWRAASCSLYLSRTRTLYKVKEIWSL